MDFDILHPIKEGDFFWSNQFVVNLADVLVSSGLVPSKRKLKDMAGIRITVFMRESTFERMRILEPFGHFAFFEGEEIMVGKNFLKRHTMMKADACPWETPGFLSELITI